ncbi:nucleotide-binding protein [Sphingobium sp. Sx8-8]|uniref:nucleotide-binding protein n=1 Tax=Sphingobium sp. Sx8-8 TaxID=2933617 RepID=UPI001F5622E6|nr:nucleotide-binding protein [Sphingobium sp. Sx8-8]
MASEQLSTDDVFINCPFDKDFKPIFQALVFTIFACGFRPRSARELDDGGQTRIDKLYGLIEECRYGIHDLSRTELDDVHKLPRFNMPLELGLFLGAKRYGDKAQHGKRLLILDIERFRYQKFISDLAGIDIHEHGGKAEAAARETRDWLANVSRRQIASADRVVRLYDQFTVDLPALAAALEFDPVKIPYVDFERIVVGWLTRDA